MNSCIYRARAVRTLSAVVGIWIVLAATAYAQTGIVSIQSAYQQYKDIDASAVKILVPTVVEIPFDHDFLERTNFSVLDTTTQAFQPSYFVQTASPAVFSASSNTGTNVGALTDNSTATFASFDVPGDRLVRTTITLRSAQSVVASALTIALDANVALPNRIAIRAEGAVVVAEKTLDSTVVRFPQTRAREWIVEFTHVQPLRVGELRLVEDNAPKGSRSLRFLAQPQHSYRVYFNPDRTVSAPTGEAGNLQINKDVYRVASQGTKNNSGYIPADVDGDGIQDIRDNCASVANPDQSDVDQNGLGDVCQDFDQDGIANVRDNCANTPNVGQDDTDGDGMGDACDTEESRFTEKYAWIPWLGIGFAALVIAALFALTIRAKKEETIVPHIRDTP